MFRLRARLRGDFEAVSKLEMQCEQAARRCAVRMRGGCRATFPNFIIEKTNTMFTTKKDATTTNTNAMFLNRAAGANSGALALRRAAGSLVCAAALAFVGAAPAVAQDGRSGMSGDERRGGDARQSQRTASSDRRDMKRIRLTDDTIEEAVMNALAKDFVINENRISVSVRNNIVTLDGEVASMLDVSRAGAIAGTLKGVEAVTNSLEVRDSGVSDSRIREHVSETLRNSSGVEFDDLTLRINDGFVTLTGDVSASSERWLARQLTSGVKGVRGIDAAGLVVQEAARQSPEEMVELAQQALKWDSHVDSGDIDVSASNGDVTLDGTVGSVAEKLRAIGIAQRAGAENVDAEGLSVKRWTRHEAFKDITPNEMKPAKVREAVMKAIEREPRVDASAVDFDLKERDMRLTGEVETLAAKSAAGKAALSTHGVESVTNHLRVMGDVDRTELRSSVERAINRETMASPDEIRMGVDDSGRVTLRGSVQSQSAKANIEDAVAEVVGVTDVDNLLVVGQYDTKTAAARPFIDSALYRYGEDVPLKVSQQYTTTMTDAQLREEIVEEFFWSPFVDSDEISLVVENGVAIVSGDVDDADDARDVIENAYEGGAVYVVSNLDYDWSEYEVD